MGVLHVRISNRPSLHSSSPGIPLEPDTTPRTQTFSQTRLGEVDQVIERSISLAQFHSSAMSVPYSPSEAKDDRTNVQNIHLEIS